MGKKNIIYLLFGNLWFNLFVFNLLEKLIKDMVVFTCGHCGESVQKPKVEKHYLTKCRNRNPNLSCMDCFKDFHGNDYEDHVKCITEEQRYAGKGFIAKEKKGEKKQNVWVEMLQSVLDEQKSAPKNVLRIIETISKHNNTPRKKPKFINFVKNVCGSKTNPKDIDQAWDLISVKLSELSKFNSVDNKLNKNNDASETNGVGETNDHKENNDIENDNEKKTNGEIVENPDKDITAKENGIDVNVDEKKISKKQRKAEKKRQKYEAELQKASEPLIEVGEKENQPIKKDKKKKNKNEISNDGDENVLTAEGKNKKRKRQDTVVSECSNGAVDTNENVIQPVVKEAGSKEKTQKKKPKVINNEAANSSICLHDQNVAATTEIEPRMGQFDWHAVILSVLEKKGNELPFKRLQKKVLNEYTEATGQDIDDRIAEKFIKKLKSAPKVKVDKNRVVLEE